MTDARTTGLGLLHVVFLERAAREQDTSQSGFGQAAFLVLRLVDLLGPDQASPTRDDMFKYQAAATDRYCQEQLEPGPHADRLLDLVSSASHAHRRHDAGLLVPAMLALARSLDEEARGPEALDVLATLERVASSMLAPTDAVSAALLAGLTQRKLAHYDAADACYDRAAALAAASGDLPATLLSRLGRANVFHGRGNLAEAEAWNREVLEKATAAGLPSVAARAEHGLGIVLGQRGQLADAIPHLWRAFTLYGDDRVSFGALHDLGYAMARLGAIESAERALRVVIARGGDDRQDMAQNCAIELMHCASFQRDRVGFERWRGECVRLVPRMAPNILADFYLKVGIGLARFGMLDRAQAELRVALKIARGNRIREFEFRIERILAGLCICEDFEVERQSVGETPAWAAPLTEVATALAGLST